MGVYYTLVNLTKREKIAFQNLPVAKACEIVGNPAASAIVTWYLMEHSGDHIGFIGDEIASPFDGVSFEDVSDYPDRTEQVLEVLIEQGILVDCGIEYQDDEDPSIYSKDVRNTWMPRDKLILPL